MEYNIYIYMNVTNGNEQRKQKIKLNIIHFYEFCFFSLMLVFLGPFSTEKSNTIYSHTLHKC